MKKLKNKIDKLYDLEAKLKVEILEEIRKYAIKTGSKIGACHFLTFDTDLDDVLDPINICVETDRHCGDMGYERLDKIHYNEDKDILFFETDSYLAAQEEMNLDDLIDIYELLEYLDNNKLDDIEIIGDTIRQKEE